MSATLIFPLGAVLVSLFSYANPHYLESMANLIVPLLGLVMLGMGMTLRPENFLEVLSRPAVIGTGVFLQFFLMPLFAFLLSTLFGLPAALTIGMVLVGTSPGGTASNVICYLARGDVALSISLTMVSTMLAVVCTPLLTWLYLYQGVRVPVTEMMLNIFKIIILPVGIGILFNTYLGTRLNTLKRIFPGLSSLSIVLIIGIIVARNHQNLAQLGLSLMAAVVCHNILGLAVSYYLCGLLNIRGKQRRAITIEVGMQNSGLAVALAQTYFSSLAALPGALFSIWHNVSGSILAGIWRESTDDPKAAVNNRG